MSEGTIHEQSRLLGELQADLRSVLRTLGEDRKAAADYRTEVRAQLRMIDTKLDPLPKKVEGLENEVEIYRQARFEIKGASRLIRIMWVVGIVAAGYAGTKLEHILATLLGGPTR